MRPIAPLVALLVLAGCAAAPPSSAPSDVSSLKDSRRGCQPQASDSYRLNAALPFGALAVHVEGPDGAPIANAQLLVSNHYAPDEIRPRCGRDARQTTDSEGNARFERLYAGAIEVSPHGRSELMQVVQIRPDETVQLRFVVAGPLPTPMPEPSR